MPQTFKQVTNPIVAFAFIGLIVVSQLLVLNMGYTIPTYFLIILIVLCGLILWGMLDIKCIIDGQQLKSKVGPFVQLFDISEIEKISLRKQRNVGSRKRLQLVDVFFASGKKITIQPLEQEAFINALKAANKKIKVEGVY